MDSTLTFLCILIVVLSACTSGAHKYQDFVSYTKWPPRTLPNKGNYVNKLVLNALQRATNNELENETTSRRLGTIPYQEVHVDELHQDIPLYLKIVLKKLQRQRQWKMQQVLRELLDELSQLLDTTFTPADLNGEQSTTALQKWMLLKYGQHKNLNGSPSKSATFRGSMDPTTVNDDDDAVFEKPFDSGELKSDDHMELYVNQNSADKTDHEDQPREELSYENYRDIPLQVNDDEPHLLPTDVRSQMPLSVRGGARNRWNHNRERWNYYQDLYNNPYFRKYGRYPSYMRQYYPNNVSSEREDGVYRPNVGEAIIIP